jgi:multisubunit Na+/H+ antiporter MnhG subunit
MIERLFANSKTTIVGLIIFLTGAVLVAFEKASLTEFGAFIGVAFALFFSKDPKSTNTK